MARTILFADNRRSRVGNDKDSAGDDCQRYAKDRDRTERRRAYLFDAVTELKDQVYDELFLCDLVRDVVQAVKRNLKVDWTKPHREDMRAGVMAAVKMVLRRKGIRAEQSEFVLNRVIEQATALYENWPVAV